MTTLTREQILALAGEPVATVARSGKRADGKHWHNAHFDESGAYDLPEGTKLFTADQLLAARKPLEEEIEHRKRDAWHEMDKLGHRNLELRQQLAEAQAALKASDGLLRALPQSGGFYGLAVMEANADALEHPGADDNDDGPGEEDGPWAPGWEHRSVPLQPPHQCRFCGQPSWLDPADQPAPPDVCHPADHGVGTDSEGGEL